MTNPNVLLNRGKEITLLDGTKASLAFDLEALAQLEDDFDSLGGWQDQLNAIAKEQIKAKMMTPLLKMLKAGLLHDPSQRSAKFDPQRIEEYFTAVMGAAELAFPQSPQGTTENATSASAISDSPGPISTTSPQLSSVAPIASSGA